MGIGRSGIGGLGIGGLGIGGLGIPSPSSDPAFIIKVDTTKAGSASDTMIIPLVSGQSYDFEIDWGDATVETYTSSALTNVTHVYTSGGVFDIKITGTFPRIFFNNTGDRFKLLDISNWGEIVWGTTIFRAFSGCTNLTGSFSDSPDLSGTAAIREMFRNCDLFNGKVELFDVSTITNMQQILEGASIFNRDLSGWQIQNVTAMLNMLNGTSFSTANYDLLLNAWSLLSVKPNVGFGANNTSYTIATSQAARDILTGGANLWTITDNGGI